MAPKPLPVPRIKKVEKDNLDVNKALEDIIAKNIFLLDVTPAPVAAVGSVDVDSDGKPIVTKDGAPLNPPPPFKAALIGIIYDEVNHAGIATINLDNNTVSISLGKTKEGITLVDLSFSFATIEKDKKKYSIVLLNHYQLISPELYDKFIDLLLIDFCCSSFINDHNFFIILNEFTIEFLPQIPFESFVSYLNDNETRIDCFEEILYYIDRYSIQ